MSIKDRNCVGSRLVSRSSWLSMGCALGALMAPAGAAAQVAADDQAAALDEIVVTAQRRAERLENVPMAVTALSSDALEKANVVSVTEIGVITPGVQISNNGNALQPSVRGVTSLTNGTGNENNVAVYIDGFYITDNTSINVDLATIKDIQILKGPQGALYGRNATGGAILINTLSPSDVLTGRFEGSYGKFNERSLSGYISAPLTERLRFLASGSFRNSDGWIGKSDPANNRNSIGDASPIKKRSFRAKLEADVTDSLTATLAYSYNMASDPIGLLFTPYDHIPAFLPGGNQRAVDPDMASFNYKSISSTRANDYMLTLEWNTGIGTLTSYTGYGRRHHQLAFDFDGTYGDITYIDTKVGQKTFQQTVDYVVDAIDNVDLVIGGQYFWEDFGQKEPNGQTTYGPGLDPRARVFRLRETKAWAVYADATINVTDRISVGLGGRYNHEKRYVTQISTTGADRNNVTLFIPEKSKSFKRFTPRATLRYELADRTNIYASYSKGFRSGSYNTSGAADPALDLPIKPEDLNAYEIGFKTAQSLFRFETAFFYYDYKNLNVALTVPQPACAGDPACPITNVVGNAPKAEVYGIDAMVSVSPLERFNIAVGGAWLHARYGSFPNAVGTGVNATNTLNISSQPQDWTGKQMARAPNFSANISADYSFPVAQGNLRLAANVAYSDSYVIANPSLFGPLAPAPLQGKQRFRQKATTIVNGSITWFSPDDSYWIGLYGKNLTDENYLATYSGAAFGDYRKSAAPISYGVKLGYKF